MKVGQHFILKEMNLKRISLHLRNNLFSSMRDEIRRILFVAAFVSETLLWTD